MKKLLLLSLMVSVSFMLNAQLKTPAASPSSKVEQAVGLTDITIEYSRPGVKGRTIFAADGLVPFGKRWRTGANAATKISFSTDVNVGGSDLEAGTYALFTTPGAAKWDVHFFNFDGKYPGDYDEATAAATISVTANKMPPGVIIETFTIMVNDITNSSANLIVMWADTEITLPVTMATNEAVYSSIDKVMAGPSYGDYYSAAVFYKENGKDLSQALKWMDKSTELRGEEKFWVLRHKSEIQAGLKDYKSAIKTAQKSLELATEAGNMDYVKMNNDNIAKWGKM